MLRLSPKYVVLLSGAFLMFAGIVMMIIHHHHAGFKLNLEALKLHAHSPGMALLGVGAFLEIVGFIGPSLWGRFEPPSGSSNS